MSNVVMATGDKIKILVACHKEAVIRQDDIYMPIQVGKALHPELDLGFQEDDTGDNISEKNGSYCELTAMYWAWKNLPKDVDIVGLCHYRRYFKLDTNNIREHIVKLLEKHDAIILPYKEREKANVQLLKELTCQEDTALFLDLLIEMYPMWKDLIGRYFYQSNSASCYNMMITKREVFNEYCSFLFPFLKALEDVLLPTYYVRMQRRIGYFAEMLLGLWLEGSDKKVVTCLLDDCNRFDLNRIFRKFRHTVAFRLFKHQPFIVDPAVVLGLKQNEKELKHLFSSEIK